MLISTPAASRGKRLTSSLTPLATSTVVVPGCRRMASTTARSLLYQLATLLFATSS